MSFEPGIFCPGKLLEFKLKGGFLFGKHPFRRSQMRRRKGLVNEARMIVFQKSRRRPALRRRDGRSRRDMKGSGFD